LTLPKLRIETARVFQPLLSPARYKVAHGGRGSGKCLGRGTLVMLASGGITRVEDVQTGDLLMGPDSKPRRVMGTTTGFGPLYRVRQKSAEDYVVNDAHILALRRSRSSREDRGAVSPAGRYQRPNGRYAGYGIETTLISAAEFAGKPERFKCHVFGFKVPVEFPESPVSIDPYLLGMWLGDGDTARVGFTNADEEVLAFLRGYASENGLSLREVQKPGQRAKSILFGNGWKREGIILSMFRAVGLLGNKHIPECYFTNAKSVRLALLAGLADSDGHAANGCLYITQKSERLALDIKRLADGLGFKTSLVRKNATLNGKAYPVATVTIGGDVDSIPVLIARKRAGLTVRKNKDWRLTRVNVEPIGDGEYFGFELDGDHLFLLADGTVTHNSHFFAELLVEDAIRHPGLRAVCIREVQKSLEQSVKRLIEDKIRALGVGSLFDVKEAEIRTPGGGLIIFQGMQNHTAESIKSLEGYQRAWAEEAQSLSQRSLDLLRPTIREPGSELWFSYNPKHESDPVDVLFRGGEPPPGSIVVEANFDSNPWLPAELKAEKDFDYSRDPEKAAHVWGGGYEGASEARIFRNYRVGEVEVPDNVVWFYGVDWGFSVDPLAGVRFCFPSDRTLYITHEAHRVGVPTEDVPAYLLECLPDLAKWPSIADSARPESIDYCRRHGVPKMKPAIKGKGSIEDGITFLQGQDIVIHPRCVNMKREADRYSYKRDRQTEEILPVAEDAWNHLWDCLRMASERLHRKGKLTAEGEKLVRVVRDYGHNDPEDYDSWKVA
jgi:phage terminase large subunit